MLSLRKIEHIEICISMHARRNLRECSRALQQLLFRITSQSVIKLTIVSLDRVKRRAPLQVPLSRFLIITRESPLPSPANFLHEGGELRREEVLTQRFATLVAKALQETNVAERCR